MNSTLRYVLITPARNEEGFIARTINAVTAQTVLPVAWAIVSDGSTDRTDDIVRQYAAQNSWIHLVRMPERRERHFAGKVHAFNAGLGIVKNFDYDVIASLDADITFDRDYFSFLLGKLSADPKLGLVGTPFEDRGRIYDYRFVSLDHVSGACQVFRRECFEAIGGYVPVKGGSIDHIAVISARMKGWKTRTFLEKRCYHHRALGTAEVNVVRAKLHQGKKDYTIGNHPVWELFRTVNQMRQRPYAIGGLALATGYMSAWLHRIERPVSDEFLAFHRHEEMQRLKRVFWRGPSTTPTNDGKEPPVQAKPQINNIERTDNRFPVADAKIGALIINADDWGRDEKTTNRTLSCIEQGVLSSVSAMVFMKDSERAASLARERGIDSGLHLNLDTPFTSPGCSSELLEHQRKLMGFLRHWFARPIFHPGLKQSFDYLISAQFDEYERLYGERPKRVDGHHHVHLAANVLLSRHLPAGTILRTHFSYQAGEKFRNRLFRAYTRTAVSGRYRTADCLYALLPIEVERLRHIITAAKRSVVEIETHPVNQVEFEFLTGGAFFELLGDCRPASSFITRK